MLNIHRHHQKLSATIGLPPGTLLHIGEKPITDVHITHISYNQSRIQEIALDSLKNIIPLNDNLIHWIHIDGIHDLKLLEDLGQELDIHSLLLEDIANSTQRPKIEEHKNFLFIVLKIIQYSEELKEIKTEQITILLGQHFVISFQEKKGDIFTPIKERLYKSIGKIRVSGADYLAYSLIDMIIDHYFSVLEKIGEEIDIIEESIIKNPNISALHDIQTIKKHVLFLRRSIWPLREMINSLERGESNLIQNSTTIYLKDAYDHIIEVIDTIETYREMIAGILEIYLSSINNKLNEIMKMLTIITTIFIPLSFIAGIYGMNFKFMPELGWRYGYFLVLGIMAMIFVGMIFYFRKKKWL